MAEAVKTQELGADIQTVWKVITDYEKYPEFVAGVHSVKVEKRDGNKARVRYGIELLGKEINYVLDHVEEAPHRMHWTMVESNIMKSNEGEWELVEQGSTTNATYRLVLDLKIYVPGMVLNGLIKKSLPSMLESFDKRAQNQK